MSKVYLVNEEVLQQVLWFLENENPLSCCNEIKTIRTILSKGPLEPVAWQHPLDIGRFWTGSLKQENDEQVPLYAIPKEE